MCGCSHRSTILHSLVGNQPDDWCMKNTATLMPVAPMFHANAKDLIKSGGEWISSVDLENALMSHAAIAEAAVIAIPDPKWSERPLACVVH